MHSIYQVKRLTIVIMVQNARISYHLRLFSYQSDLLMYPLLYPLPTMAPKRRLTEDRPHLASNDEDHDHHSETSSSASSEDPEYVS